MLATVFLEATNRSRAATWHVCMYAALLRTKRALRIPIADSSSVCATSMAVATVRSAESGRCSGAL